MLERHSQKFCGVLNGIDHEVSACMSGGPIIRTEYLPAERQMLDRDWVCAMPAFVLCVDQS